MFVLLLVIIIIRIVIDHAASRRPIINRVIGIRNRECIRNGLMFRIRSIRIDRRRLSLGVRLILSMSPIIGVCISISRGVGIRIRNWLSGGIVRRLSIRMCVGVSGTPIISRSPSIRVISSVRVRVCMFLLLVLVLALLLELISQFISWCTNLSVLVGITRLLLFVVSSLVFVVPLHVLLLFVV